MRSELGDLCDELYTEIREATLEDGGGSVCDATKDIFPSDKETIRDESHGVMMIVW